MAHAYAGIKDECSASFMKNMHQNENENENEKSPSTLYNETYKEKDLERMKNQVFDVEEKEELSDIKCLAEFYRDFFKEFVCSLRGGESSEVERMKCVEIRFTLLSLDELDQDLDFDELHYSRILGEFRRILDIYAKELCKSLEITVQICENQNENENKKSRMQRTYSCQNGWIKYEEQFV